MTSQYAAVHRTHQQVGMVIASMCIPVHPHRACALLVKCQSSGMGRSLSLGLSLLTVQPCPPPVLATHLLQDRLGCR
jgi:hypothetical protein